MKKYILALLTLAIFIGSCKKKTIDPAVNLGAVPSLTAPTSGTVFILDENKADDILTTFTWSAADFGYDAAVNYSVQIDAVGNDFAEAVAVGVSTDLKLDNLTIGRLNNILLAKGLPFGFENELEIRVCAKVSDLVEELCSEAVPIKVSPFQAEVVYPKLTVPGDYQSPNTWDPGDENYAVYSRKSDEIYTGYIYFPIDGAVYKFAQGGNWDTNWGDIDPADGVLDMGGIDNNIPINDGVGMYLLNCDLNTLTHFNIKTQWGVLGDATAGGWDTDVDFVWDDGANGGLGALTATLDLTVGEIKFRANDDWDINFGDNFNNGTLEADGDNIPIAEAGNYTIELILNVADYYFTLTKN